MEMPTASNNGWKVLGLCEKNIEVEYNLYKRNRKKKRKAVML
jgi:hypothetical protein